MHLLRQALLGHIDRYDSAKMRTGCVWQEGLPHPQLFVKWNELKGKTHKSQTSATNVIMHPRRLIIWEDIWRHTPYKSHEISEIPPKYWNHLFNWDFRTVYFETFQFLLYWCLTDRQSSIFWEFIRVLWNKVYEFALIKFGKIFLLFGSFLNNFHHHQLFNRTGSFSPIWFPPPVNISSWKE